MFSFRRWHGFALLLLTVQVPAFAQGIDFNTRSFQGGPINEGTVGQLTVKWVYQTVPDTGTRNTLPRAASRPLRRSTAGISTSMTCRAS